MKQLLFSLLMLFVASFGYSQSAYDIMNSHGTSDVSTKQASSYNPYFGAELSYSLDEDKPVSESFLLSAKITYVVAAGDNWAFPVASSFGLNSDDLLNPESGFNVGVFPWYLVTKNVDAQLKFIVHGGLNYKVITEGVGGSEAPQQFKAIGGIEAIFVGDDGQAPTTLSVTPVYYLNNVADDFGALEITGVLPVAPGLALLAEGNLPFQNGIGGDVRLGIIVTTQL